MFLDDLPLEGRARIDVSGADSQRFLQGLLSADVEKIASGTAIPAALLTTKGKLISDAVIFGRGMDFSILVPQDRYEEVAEKLDKHIIMDEVELDRREDERCALVWDDDHNDDQDDGRVWLVDDAPGLTRVRVRYPGPGTLCIGPRAMLEEQLSDVPRSDAAKWAQRRIELGIPAWGHEIEPGRFPPEVGFVSAVSYEKGCYLGQEPLARIHARGQVNHVMVRLQGDAQPADRELRDPDGKVAGQWTTWSAAGSNRFLGIVHRRFADDSTSLQAADGTVLTVISGPIGDDAGN
jgi:folate-binding protein YgfZ